MHGSMGKCWRETEIEQCINVCTVYGNLIIAEQLPFPAAPAILEYIAYLYDQRKKPSPAENAYLGRNEDERSVARALASAVSKPGVGMRSLRLICYNYPKLWG